MKHFERDSLTQARHQQQAVAENRANWDDRAIVHAGGGYGDLDALAQDANAITPVVHRDLAVLEPHLPQGGVSGLSLLHLQCHIGTDTLSWRRLGARDVHGLDFSPASLEQARRLAERAGESITYVEADARYADQALPNKRFDLIVTSVGTVTWLPELGDWARSIAHLLKPGGIFMIRDAHPLLLALDEQELRITSDYLSGSEDAYQSDGSYTPGSAGRIAHTSNHNWSHDFQEMTGVLLAAGLTIEALGEYPGCEWQAMPSLEWKEDEGLWRLPEGSPRIPLSFSIVARKPRLSQTAGAADGS
ncbi:SAM dependent methyltransferase [Bifidobacterium actinocoloniiforme DSM 22766]|uniref:SAM dependent methyltransferase n=1 Tax=Bifidobacterium actinocoloniiforme DSM 22766 TaxID=1437605 RepID=A0A086Z0I1_9BIFI|nr:class I SAM-dependent methyltransferase [Bifidobacterium actinocoloniiforme]AKV55257.1 SAM-dependent methyltransferase [Bifidobacterium actinocoloniiforme DSM 22766]KFI40031.1 SAM dependent methyltransferase [Bifidobacterium actinocoloniiforme DSM 22766]